MKVNVLKYKKTVCISPVNNGLPDYLFDAGVRIVVADVDSNQGKEIIKNEDLTALSFSKFTEQFVQEEKDPGRAWKGKTINKWDNKKDSFSIY